MWMVIAKAKLWPESGVVATFDEERELPGQLGGVGQVPAAGLAVPKGA
jgi:hypothetical protein